MYTYSHIKLPLSYMLCAYHITNAPYHTKRLTQLQYIFILRDFGRAFCYGYDGRALVVEMGESSRFNILHS